MLKYIIRRVISSIPVVILLSMVVFTLMQLMPGDVAVALLGPDADPQQLTALRHELGLDRPIYVQYMEWVGNALQGDLGRSFRTRIPVGESLIERLPITLELMFFAILWGMFIGMTAGIISAIRRNSKLDMGSTVGALLGVSIPDFWLGIMLIMLFALVLRWLPPSGYIPFFDDPIGNLKLMLLPAITLGSATGAVQARLVRSSMIEVLNQEYILTAWAKGLRERVIIARHALKNALIPPITMMGIQIGRLFGGAIIVETIFALPGIGKLMVDSIFSRDFIVVQGVILLMALGVLLSNLLVDLIYAFLDPRIRYG